MRGHNDKTRASEQRRRIALEAARLMSEHGIRDFHQAKRKAAERFGIHDDLLLPKNSEVEAALREHQRLFHAATQPGLLRRRREVALEAMRFLARFEPRLVGAVLEGSADRYSSVTLHLFCDDSSQVEQFLLERGVPLEVQSRRLRFNREEWREFPVYLFSADDTPIDLTVLPVDLIRQAPMGRVDERPIRRASLAALEELLQTESEAQPLSL